MVPLTIGNPVIQLLFNDAVRPLESGKRLENLKGVRLLLAAVTARAGQVSFYLLLPIIGTLRFLGTFKIF